MAAVVPDAAGQVGTVHHLGAADTLFLEVELKGGTCLISCYSILQKKETDLSVSLF